MTEVLSQDEIDQLLSAINAGETTIDDVTKTTHRKKSESMILRDLPNSQKINSVPYE